MNGLMMHYPLTVPAILKRVEALYGCKELVNQQPDGSWHRYTYRDLTQRAKKLAVALWNLGVQSGDRVATLCWNHSRHHEAYFGIPCGGFVLHTLNLRLHPNDLAYIADHAGDRAVIVDRSLVPLLEQFKDRTQIEHATPQAGPFAEHNLNALIEQSDFNFAEFPRGIFSDLGFGETGMVLSRVRL